MNQNVSNILSCSVCLVPVSVVRDLYGTVLNEGIVKRTLIKFINILILKIIKMTEE